MAGLHGGSSSVCRQSGPKMGPPADRPRPGPRLRSISNPNIMTRSLCLLLLTTLLTAAPALAQSHAEAMVRLAAFEGTYTLDGTAQIEEGTFDGTLTVSPILGGHFQQWDWEMDMRGEGVDEKVHLRFIATYDGAADEYVIYRFDSRDADSPTRVSHVTDPNRGRIHFDGNALVMAWPTANPGDPSATGTFRNTVRVVSDGLTVSTEVKPDDGNRALAIATTRANRR